MHLTVNMFYSQGQRIEITFFINLHVVKGLHEATIKL